MGKIPSGIATPFILLLGSLFFGLWFTGAFNPHAYLVKVIWTSGPDFWVLSGENKLKRQMPDSVSAPDCSGLMTDAATRREIYAGSSSRYAYETDYYYVLYGRVTGVQSSDGDRLHPLVRIQSFRRIHLGLFWGVLLSDFLLFAASAFVLLKRLRRSAPPSFNG